MVLDYFTAVFPQIVMAKITYYNILIPFSLLKPEPPSHLLLPQSFYLFHITFFFLNKAFFSESIFLIMILIIILSSEGVIMNI